MDQMLQPYYRYADFQGRSSRSEYWMFVLFNVLVITGLVIVTLIGLFSAGGTGALDRGNFPILALLGGGAILMFALFSFIPNLAVQVRRFHDQDKSGWLILLGFIPYAGGIIMLVFMCLAGTRGPNQYGPDPLDPYASDVFR